MINEEEENEDAGIKPEGAENSSVNEADEVLHQVTSINGLYENWFLDYASYVILDRAVPHLKSR